MITDGMCPRNPITKEIKWKYYTRHHLWASSPRTIKYAHWRLTCRSSGRLHEATMTLSPMRASARLRFPFPSCFRDRNYRGIWRFVDV